MSQEYDGQTSINCMKLILGKREDMRFKNRPILHGHGVRESERFGARLKAWRRMNNLKQEALAQMLGVSQPAIARWESGLDAPSTERLGRLQTLMARTMQDDLVLERLFINRQAAMRALFDYDGVRMLVTSEGFRKVWPKFSLLVDTPMIDHMVGDVRSLVHDGDLRQQILDGSLGIVSGVSERHADHEIDVPIRNRWHICFRQYGPRVLADMVYEPCEPDAPTGITEFLHLDALMA